MISFDEALTLVEGASRPLGTEHIPLEDAAGRVLASPVKARIDGPRFDVSTMDGYAVRSDDLVALPCSLRVVGEVYPGAPFGGTIAPGSCVRIFTGAPLPAGTDRIVIQEVVERDGEQALFAGPLSPALYIRRKASDFAVGDALVPAGRRLDAKALVAAAAADVAAVDVFRQPNVLIVGTGDELVEPGSAAASRAAIPESISLGLAALAAGCGGKVLGRHLLADDLPLMRRRIAEWHSEADVIIVTGGASVGERDHAKKMFDGLELIFSKVAIKPGKPVWLGRLPGRLVMGLPGNPTSALVTARLLLMPLLTGLAGGDPKASLNWRRTALATAMEAGSDRETFWRGKKEDGKVVLVPNQDSGAQRTLAEADLLVRQHREAAPLAPGDEVEVIDF